MYTLIIVPRKYGRHVSEVYVGDPVGRYFQQDRFHRLEFQGDTFTFPVMVHRDLPYAALILESATVFHRVGHDIGVGVGQEDVEVVSILTAPEVRDVVTFYESLGGNS